MKILLIRHAKAVPSDSWEGDEPLRPLTEVGREQAAAIAERLREESVTRVLSAPALRCQQSVEPLAQMAGLSVEVDERLGEDEPVQRALELLPARDDGAVALCTHAALIPPFLRAFELPEGDDGQIACPKGSVWMLQGPGPSLTSAAYLEPIRWRARSKLARAGSAVEPVSARLAVLDLGSTSFNLLIADVTRKGDIRPMVTEKVGLRLGAVIASHGKIPKDVVERAVEVARELRAVADQEKAQVILPVATAAIRDASNGAGLARRIGRAIETPVRVLSGAEEARFIFRAFQQRVHMRDGESLGMDLGGGSLEIAAGSRGGIELEMTLPLGVARIHRELVTRDPLKKSELKRIRRRVLDELAPYRDSILARPLRRTIAAGGAVRALARLLRERRATGGETSAPQVINTEVLAELAEELADSTHDERLSMRGIRKTRADLLPTAAVIVLTLLEDLGIEEFVVSDWGLREGVLLKAVEDVLGG